MIHSLCYHTQIWAQVHPFSTSRPWYMSTTWLESPVVYSVDWTWCGCGLYKVPQLTVQSRNQAMKSKQLSVDLRDRIVLRHITDLGKATETLKLLKSTVASITHELKTFRTTRTLPRAGRRPNWAIGKKGLGQGGDQEPDGHSDKVPVLLWGNGRTCQKDKHLWSTPPVRLLW